MCIRDSDTARYMESCNLLRQYFDGPAITLVITFCMIDMFDTIGTLVGTASRAGICLLYTSRCV